MIDRATIYFDRDEDKWIMTIANKDGSTATSRFNYIENALKLVRFNIDGENMTMTWAEPGLKN